MDKEATLETVEAALDTVDKVKPSSFNLNGTTKGQQVAYLAAAGLVGALAGSGVTYLISKKYLKAKYEEIARQEIEEAKEFYSALITRFDGQRLTRLEMLQFTKEHELTHRSQMFLYLRLNGVVPPTTRRRQAKSNSR